MSAKLIFLAFAAIACQVNGQSWNQGFRPGFLSNLFNMMYGQQQQQPQQQYPFMFNSPIGQFLWPQRPQIIPSIPSVPSVPPHFRPPYRPPPVSPFYSSEEQDQGFFVDQPGTFDIKPDYVEPGFFDTAGDNAFNEGNSFEESQDVTSEEIDPDNDEVIQPVFPEGVQISPPHPGQEQQLEEFPQEFPENHEVVNPINIPDEGLTFTGESNEEGVDESPEIGLQFEEEPEELDVSEEEAVPQEAILSEQPLLQAPLV